MASYFITRTPERESALVAAMIPVEAFSIDRQTGYLFDTARLDSVLTALASDVVSETRTEYDGIQFLNLRPARARTTPAAPVARLAGGLCNFSVQRHIDSALAIASEMAPRFGVREVVLHDNSDADRSRDPIHDLNTLHIFFWCAPRGRVARGDGTSASQLWGHRTSPTRGEWNVWRHSGVGELIADDNGTQVAEVVGNNIYTFYPLTSRDVSTSVFAPIFRRILEEALLLQGTPEERAERDRQRQERLLEELRSEPVVIDTWDATRDQRSKFAAIAAEFASIFGKQIRLNNFCGGSQTRAPVSDGRLHVHIWASPRSPEDGGQMRQTLFGAPLAFNGKYHCVIKPMGDGVILTDEDENQVGMMVGDNIYIHYPLAEVDLRLRWDGNASDALFRRILEEAVFVKTATEEQKSARARTQAARFHARTRVEYMKACNGRFDKALEHTRMAVKNGPLEIQELQAKLVRRIRELSGQQRKLEQMESTRPEAIEAYGKEFDRLLEVPKIRDVKVQAGVVQVFTDILHCVDPRTKLNHVIGRFRIEIRSDGDVRWFNLDRTIRGYHAPHVFSDGQPCLGNMTEVIPELVANYEYAALAMVCIQFVESVNVNDVAGDGIRNWPVAA